MQDKSASSDASTRPTLNVRDRGIFALPGLSIRINESWLAALDHFEAATNCGAEIFRISNGSFGVHAETLRELCKVDGRIVYRSADLGAIDATTVTIGHDLYLHDFLMIGAVVMHHAKKGNAMVRCGPENARGIHQIAIALNVDRKAAIFAVGERGADSGGSTVPDSCATLTADILIMFVKRPETLRPAIDKGGGGDERPILVLYTGP